MLWPSHNSGEAEAREDLAVAETREASVKVDSAKGAEGRVDLAREALAREAEDRVVLVREASGKEVGDKEVLVKEDSVETKEASEIKEVSAAIEALNHEVNLTNCCEKMI